MAGKATSLRFRTLIVSVACIIGTLAVAGVSLVVVFEKHVLEMIGKDLDIRWSELARDLTLDHKGEPQLFETLSDSRYRTLNSGAYWQISDGGAPLLTSPSLGSKPLDLSQAGPERAAGKWFELETEDAHELYVVEREVSVGPLSALRRFKIVIALDHEQVASARSAFVQDMIVVLGLISLVLLAAAGLQLKVITQPLARLARELGAIREGRQTRFLASVPVEVEPLAADLNRLLAGQEQLVKKARERAGSLAHGLKTPLAILSAENRRLEAEGQVELAKRLREQVCAIQTHVERELARARSNAASSAIGTVVDASKAAERLVRAMQRMPRGETLAWRCDAPEQLILRIDADDFGEILGNLLDNARKWAATSVTLRFEATGGSVRVIVEDDGPGFGANAAPPTLMASERENSAGLGLVIVQDILAAYGSSLWIDRGAPNGVASFVLPAGAARAARGPDAQRDEAGARARWGLAPTKPGPRLAN